ncbi:2-phospho-L-lactate guanylyltransferase [Promicromonospora umidemergens]|uniref:Phosphoenolpyruvate guanylyltransferase n=1 Tax=Promicromonospora umidemergens TaxID=629679 RepID=A0ABP8WUE0_9MICO|nr:NTP transferase domain-containing protein [Promicromonospora umidemergens]MCP2283561.1 2-phospho-L-lactate guanylyltransferase [Promicromonospora umidemergens]
MTGFRPGSRGTTAVVPLRDGVSGKSRLAAVLDAGSRRRLVRVLARHVVTTLLATGGIGRVVVVTADPVFTRETLAGLDVEVLEQPAGRPGLNAALEHAREVLAARSPGLPPGTPSLGTPVPGPGRLLVAHADLPALTPEDVGALLAEAAPVVVATDRYRSGTNLLLLPFETEADPLSAAAERSSLGLEGDRDEVEVSGFRFRFGLGSLAAHLAEAEARGLDVTVVHRPGTAVDLDTADDWSQLPDEVRAAVGQQVPGLL